VWRTEALEVLSPGQTMQVADTTLRFDGVDLVQGPNYQAAHANIEAIRGGKLVAMLAPEKRAYPVEGEVISDTSIRTTGFSDLYVALGDDRGGGRWVIRAYENPLAPFIWFGGAIMALGGFASLWSRLRVRFARAGATVAAE
jgi:cytochrome c-type biogenesis protein CcmF